MSEKKKEADRARIRLKRENETEPERNARIGQKRTYLQSEAGKQAKKIENAKRYAKTKKKLVDEKH